MSDLTKFNEDIFSIIKEYLLIKDFNNLTNTCETIKYECVELSHEIEQFKRKNRKK